MANSTTDVGQDMRRYRDELQSLKYFFIMAANLADSEEERALYNDKADEIETVLNE